MGHPSRSFHIALTAVLLWGAAAFARAPVIVIDPGHGGPQDGAVGPRGEREKEIALQISRKLRSELQTVVGARVLLTREGDTDLHLTDRVAWANRKRPDLFISIHMNSMPTRRLRERVQGIETYFLSASASGAEAASTADRENAEGARQQEGSGADVLAFILADLQRAEAHADSSRLAYAVHQKLVEETRGVDRGVQQAPFFVLNGLSSPAILVEVGYLSHPDESQKLKSKAYQEKLARAIAAGVKDFFGQVQARDRGSMPGTTSGMTSAAP